MPDWSNEVREDLLHVVVRYLEENRYIISYSRYIAYVEMGMVRGQTLLIFASGTTLFVGRKARIDFHDPAFKKLDKMLERCPRKK